MGDRRITIITGLGITHACPLFACTPGDRNGVNVLRFCSHLLVVFVDNLDPEMPKLYYLMTSLVQGLPQSQSPKQKLCKTVVS